MDARDDAVEYNGHLYLEVKNFAYHANKTTQTIYRLIDKGNAIRKLRVERVVGKPMVPIEELWEFPCAAPGPHGGDSITYFMKAPEKGEQDGKRNFSGSSCAHAETGPETEAANLL
jgi:hypothetical protein